MYLDFACWSILDVLNIASLCLAFLLFYLCYLLTVIVYFVEGSRTFMVFQNLCESSIRCNISVLALVCSGLEFSRCKRSI